MRGWDICPASWVRRSGWEAALAAAPIEPYLKGYVHTYLIAKMLSEESIWLCVPDTLVGCRLGNESFLARDEFARTRVDIVGYDLAFGDTLGRGHRAYRRAMSDVASFYVRTQLSWSKAEGGQHEILGKRRSQCRSPIIGACPVSGFEQYPLLSRQPGYCLLPGHCTAKASRLVSNSAASVGQ